MADIRNWPDIPVDANPQLGDLILRHRSPSDPDNAMVALETIKALLVVLASQQQAEAGTANDVLMTPLRTKQAIDELAPDGSSTFTGLTDTPASLSGTGGQFWRTNAGEAALEAAPIALDLNTIDGEGPGDPPVFTIDGGAP